MKNILALDTASSVASAALSAGDRDYSLTLESGAGASELLMPAVDDLFRKAGLRPCDLDGAACTAGPGSFTGLRIGFSTVKGLAVALGIPFTAVPTLDCMALACGGNPGESPLVIPAIDAKKNCFFCALYLRGERKSGYLDISAGDLASLITQTIQVDDRLPVLVTGPDAPLLISQLGAFFPPESLVLDSGYRKGWALEALLLAKDLLKEGPASSPAPFYLRKSDAELMFYSKGRERPLAENSSMDYTGYNGMDSRA